MIFFERSLGFPTDVRWFWTKVWVNTNFKYWLYRRGNLLHVKRSSRLPQVCDALAADDNTTQPPSHFLLLALMLHPSGRIL